MSEYITREEALMGTKTGSYVGAPFTVEEQQRAIARIRGVKVTSNSDLEVLEKISQQMEAVYDRMDEVQSSINYNEDILGVLEGMRRISVAIRQLADLMSSRAER